MFVLTPRPLAHGGEDAYEALLQAEQEVFDALPWAIRKAAGRPCYLKSAMDWEIRRWLAPHLHRYCLLPEAFQKGYFSRLLRPMYLRFPDASPYHEDRALDTVGQPTVHHYNYIYKQYMLGMVGRAVKLATGGNAGKRSAATTYANQMFLQGRMRQMAPHVLYGITHAEEIGVLVDQRLADEKKKDKAFNVEKGRIAMLNKVQSELYKALPKKQQKPYVDRSKKLTIDPNDPEQL